MWQLPLWEEYGELIKSDIADLKMRVDVQPERSRPDIFLKEFAGGSSVGSYRYSRNSLDKQK